MKHLIYSLVFLCSSYLSAQDWVTLKDVDLGFRVDFPVEATKSSTDVPTAKGNLTLHNFIAYPSSSDINVMYMSSFSEYPESFFPNGLKTQEQMDSVLEGAVNGAVTNVKGKLLSKETISFNGYPGRFFKIEVDQGELYVLTMWNILVDYKMYIIQTIAIKGNEDNANAVKFRDSFELIKVKQ